MPSIDASFPAVLHRFVGAALLAAQMLFAAPACGETLTFESTVVGGTSQPQIYRVNNTTATPINLSLRLDYTSCSLSFATPPGWCSNLRNQDTKSFQFLNDCGPVPVGGYCDIQVVFTPVAARTISAYVTANYVLGALAGFQVTGTATPGQITPGTTLAVEFFNAQRDHYFMTDRADEIAALDTGAKVGWTRTGFSFWVWPTAAVAPPGASPVCRFYGRPEAGIDSHFYTASVDECAAVNARFSAAWIEETPAFFYAFLPDIATGACPAGTAPIYRMYNQKADAGHRYLVQRDGVWGPMLFSGWIIEGYGPLGVVMCSAPGVYVLAPT